MFRSKRSSLVKRLWKKRLSQTSGIDSNNPNDEECRRRPEQIEVIDIQVKTCVQSMLKRLKESQLQALIEAIDSRGGQVSNCVLVPKDVIKVGKRDTICPHVLCCRLWRWPHIRHCDDLKPLHWCKSSPTDPICVCINPYHWSQICRTGIQSSEVVTTSEDRPFIWCTLAYWELRNRVGRLFPVYSDGIDVFADLPQGEGLWLEPWFSDSSSSNQESVCRTRDKIGFGVTISREKNGVWVYNRSNRAIFVNSPTLDPPNTRNLTVFKVLPGFSIKVFDYELAKNYKKISTNEVHEGPMDPNAFRISFAKGWGPDYCRQFITSCPCWLEVLLSTDSRHR